jgi:UDP-glucose 4-epimerase
MTDQQTAHILATGGAGYIGSHVVTSLMAAGYDVTILDDFSNAHPQVIERINALSNRRVSVVEGDVRDGDFLDRVFAETKIDGVIHLAGLKAVAESVADPARYYDVNVGGAVALMQGMQRAEVKRLVFSSSATVYGDPDHSPVPEDAPLRPVNPYGRSKLMVERILTDAAAADPDRAVRDRHLADPVGGADPRPHRG